ncbi:MAG: hypothetical protein E6X99_23065 [Pantoea sp.]|nr:hypothetical protein [Pantoea sp.]
MPFVIVSTATAAQIFQRREDTGPNSRVIGRVLQTVTINGGAGLAQDVRQSGDTRTWGQRLPTKPACDFATTILSDEQYDWLKDQGGFNDMVMNGYLRAMPVSEKEAAKFAQKPVLLELEVEHLIPEMKETDGGRQLTEKDFADTFTGTAVKVSTGGR